MSVTLLALTRPLPPLQHPHDLVVFAGKTCYQSFEPGPANINLTRTRTDPAAFVANLIRQRHYSVLEHVSATFLFDDVSRVFTHELVRHRHLSFSQLSGRFVLPRRLDAAIPDAPPQLPQPIVDELNALYTRLRQAYDAVIRHYEPCIDNVPFSTRKVWTSWIRRFLPQATTTKIVVTGNVRAWREVFLKRCRPEAETEIRRELFAAAELLAKHIPLLMQGLVFDRETRTVEEHDL